MTSQNPIVILGSGGHARVVADACARAGRSVAGFLDPEVRPGDRRGDLEVLGNDGLLADARFMREHDFIVGVGDQRERIRLAREVNDRGGQLTSLIHPSAVMAPGIPIGAGSVILAGAVVNVGTKIGRCVIIHSNATVDHDGQLEDGIQVCPSAALAGEVTCRREAFIGIGARVIQGRTIGERAVVGAGAVVIEDVPPDVTVVGNPARIVRRAGG